jgi:hypothetical protein
MSESARRIDEILYPKSGLKIGDSAFETLLGSITETFSKLECKLRKICKVNKTGVPRSNDLL